MDPNSNIREQIYLLEKGSLSSHDKARLRDLREALRYWLQSGGFPPSRDLVQRLVRAGGGAHRRSRKHRR